MFQIVNALSVTETRRPLYRALFGTECFQYRFVSCGITRTVPFAASKSRLVLVVTELSRKTRVSPKEMVTIGASEAMFFVLSR